jgi:hypothetical protein
MHIHKTILALVISFPLVALGFPAYADTSTLTVAIHSPTDGSVVSENVVTLEGLYADSSYMGNALIAEEDDPKYTVTVSNTSTTITVTKTGLGTWNAEVPLNGGVNTIIAKVTKAGTSDEATHTIQITRTVSSSNPPANTSSGGSSSGGGSGNGGEEPQLPSKTPAVKGVTSAKDAIQNHLVPSVVGRLFQQVFGRTITPQESIYWKARARNDKRTESALAGAMQWHKLRNRTIGK